MSVMQYTAPMTVQVNRVVNWALFCLPIWIATRASSPRVALVGFSAVHATFVSNEVAKYLLL